MGDARQTKTEAERAEEPKVAGLTPFIDALRVPPVIEPGRREAVRGITIEQRAAWARLHSELPPTKVWTYDGHYPGPTIDVPRGRLLRVSWTNSITGTLPVTAAQQAASTEHPAPADEPGSKGAQPIEGVDKLPPWTTAHLHGARTNGGNDGWPENGISPGDAQLAEYPNDQPATALWYHDHAMDITRWTVFAGLAGLYVVRDEEEAALRLPSDEREIPLIIQDRNFDTDDDGHLTGRLLHKTLIVAKENDGTPVSAPFFGPYTLVNGTVWPHLDVDACWYRFRVLNASNARVYGLQLLDEETQKPVTGAVYQIGTDSGLLPRPVPVDDRLAVAPAERVDLLINFAALRGMVLRLINTIPNPAAPKVTYPQVMQFRVSSDTVKDTFVLPEVISPHFERITKDNAPKHKERLILLTPVTEVTNGHPEMWEMHEVDPSMVKIPSEGVVQIKGPDGRVRTYQRGARTFDDALSFMVEFDTWEQWSFLNLGVAAAHPMHIHLVEFQALSRDRYPAPPNGTFDPDLGGTRAPLEYGGDIPITPGDQGWKDTIQVPAGQMVNVMGRFHGAKGRFVYHCHLLEHEDMGMMRPFVVMPPEVLAFHHHHPGGGGHDHGEH